MKRALQSESEDVKRRRLETGATSSHARAPLSPDGIIPFKLEIIPDCRPVIRCRREGIVNEDQSENLLIGDRIYQVYDLPRSVKSSVTFYVPYQIYSRIYSCYAISSLQWPGAGKICYAKRFEGKVAEIEVVEFLVKGENSRIRKFMDISVIIKAARKLIDNTLINIGQAIDLPPDLALSLSVNRIRIFSDGMQSHLRDDSQANYGMVTPFTSCQVISDSPNLVLTNDSVKLNRVNIEVTKAEPYHQNSYPVICPIQIIDLVHLQEQFLDKLKGPFLLEEKMTGVFSWSGESDDKSLLTYKVKMPCCPQIGLHPPSYRIVPSTRMFFGYENSDDLFIAKRTSSADFATIEIYAMSIFSVRRSESSFAKQIVLDPEDITNHLILSRVRMLLQEEHPSLEDEQKGIILQKSNVALRMNLIKVEPRGFEQAYMITHTTQVSLLLHQDSQNQVILTNGYRAKCKEVVLELIPDKDHTASFTLDDVLVRRAIGSKTSVGHIISVTEAGIEHRLRVIKAVFPKSTETYQDYRGTTRTIGVMHPGTVIELELPDEPPPSPVPETPPGVEMIVSKLRGKIGGHEPYLNKIVEEIIIPRTVMSEEFKIRGFKPACGIIFHGPPGTGKTALARNISECLGIRPENIKMVCGSSLFVKWVGDSEQRVRDLFQDAKNSWREYGINAPLHAIIIDEIDALLGDRDRCTTGVDRKVVNQFLSELDGLEKIENLVCFGTTNRMDIMDEAVLRSGRFGIKLEFKLPDAKARTEILKIYLEKLGSVERLGKIDLEAIVAATEGLNGADLEQLVSEASMVSLKRMIASAGEGTPKVSLVEQADLLRASDGLRKKDNTPHRMYV